MSTHANATHITAIEDQLHELASAERTRWQAVSRLLLQVESESLWQEHATSFTSWIDGIATRAAIQPSGLWRSLKAGRIYLELTESDDPQVLDNLDVTAESLELVDKISRHAPARVTKQVVKHTLDGEMRVQELRTVWQTYRPAAGGLTARGRLPSDPDKRSEALETRSSQWAAQKRKPEVKVALAASEIQSAIGAFDWLGPYDQAELVLDIATDGLGADAVATVRRSSENKSRIEHHGIEIKGSDAGLGAITALRSTVDYLWLAVPASCEAAALKMPAYVGVLAFRRSGLSVVRAAKKQRVDAAARNAWLVALVSRAYGWTTGQARR